MSDVADLLAAELPTLADKMKNAHWIYQDVREGPLVFDRIWLDLSESRRLMIHRIPMSPTPVEFWHEHYNALGVILFGTSYNMRIASGEGTSAFTLNGPAYYSLQKTKHTVWIAAAAWSYSIAYYGNPDDVAQASMPNLLPLLGCGEAFDRETRNWWRERMNDAIERYHRSIVDAHLG